MSHGTLEETVYNGRDNTIDLVLKQDGTALNHTTLTRLALELRGGSLLADSDASPAAFDFTNADKVVLKLGGLGLPTGRHTVTLVAYDATNTSGIEWAELTVVVR